MFSFAVSVSELQFWVTALIAVVLLNSVTQPVMRRWLGAAINLGFIAYILRQDVAAVLAGLILLLGVLRLARGRMQALLLTVGIAGGGLFMLNNLGEAGLFMLMGEASFRLDPVRNVLAVVGFSYVFLRLIEVARAVGEGRHEPPDFPSLVNYLLPFHMLAAGPIEDYDDFVAQPAVPEPLRPLETLQAIERVAWGLAKKFVLAFAIKEVFLTDFHEVSPYLLIEVQLFFLWLYLDFSAYSDIAVGLGRLMGVHTPENFDRPYLARNMIDFWERWHISLSLFIRRNIYIPIFATLMRRDETSSPLGNSTMAFTIAFILCGLWHDLSIQFLMWGGLHAFGLVVTNAYMHVLRTRMAPEALKAYQKSRVIRMIATVVTYEFVAFTMLALFFPKPQ